VVFPCHPRTESSLRAAGLWERTTEQFAVTEPVGYLDFIRLLDAADRVVTDSGGVQKEAFFLDTPCITLREETEWTETVEAGWNVLVGTDVERIATALSQPFDLRDTPTPYGDGHAAHRVVSNLAAGDAWPDIPASAPPPATR
jgi:UDP-N-acetylglucosamine 2-epimerase (non-hydrolysing)